MSVIRSISDKKSILLSLCTELFNNREIAASKTKALALAIESIPKIDPVRAAEIETALHLLHACFISMSGTGSDKRLSQADDIAVREIQRPAKSSPETHLHSRARYVLAAIAHIRGEPEVCVSHIASMAIVAPRWFRGEFPVMFEAVFRPEFGALCDQLEADKDAEAGKSHIGAVVTQRAGAVAVGIGVGAAVIAGLALTGSGRGANPAVKNIALSTAKPIWQSATSKKIRAAKLAQIDERFEQQLDVECRSIAIQLL
jgi:hypothetical protein